MRMSILPEVPVQKDEIQTIIDKLKLHGKLCFEVHRLNVFKGIKMLVQEALPLMKCVELVRL